MFRSFQKIVRLWNKYCPKLEFNRLRSSQRVIFLENCLKNGCKAYQQRLPSYSLCISVEKLYTLVKKWEKESTTKSEQEVAESALSITASSIGVISSGVSIIAAGIGCHVARITMSSVSSVVPNVAFGLKSIVDGTLAYARRVSVVPTDLSGQVASLYQDAHSIFSNPMEENDIIETTFIFWEQPDSANDLLDDGIESANEFLEDTNEIRLSPYGAPLEDNHFIPGFLEQFIKNPSEIPLKFTTEKTREVLYTTSEKSTYENKATSRRPLWKVILESWGKVP